MTNFKGEEKLQACHVEKYFSRLKQHYLDDRKARWPVVSRGNKEHFSCFKTFLLKTWIYKCYTIDQGLRFKTENRKCFIRRSGTKCSSHCCSHSSDFIKKQ